MKPLVIGSRGSKLALTQTNWVADQIRNLNPGLEVTIEIIKTTGDKMTTASLVALAGDTKGLFVKEIEEAMLAGTVDLAVHSLKDVPTALPPELMLGAIPRREDPRDALISNHALSTIADIPQEGRIGTSSLRRQIQIQARRPDLQIIPIRGNVDTRIRKMNEENLDGVVLALAGLRRMGLQDLAAYVFSTDEIVPAVGQGSLAIEIRKNDPRVADCIAGLEHSDTRLAVTAERLFLSGMGGGCQVPMGAHVHFEGEKAFFSTFLASPSGKKAMSKKFEGTRETIPQAALQAVTYYKERGADELLNEEVPQ